MSRPLTPLRNDFPNWKYLRARAPIAKSVSKKRQQESRSLVMSFFRNWIHRSNDKGIPRGIASTQFKAARVNRILCSTNSRNANDRTEKRLGDIWKRENKSPKRKIYCSLQSANRKWRNNGRRGGKRDMNRGLRRYRKMRAMGGGPFPVIGLPPPCDGYAPPPPVAEMSAHPTSCQTPRPDALPAIRIGRILERPSPHHFRSADPWAEHGPRGLVNDDMLRPRHPPVPRRPDGNGSGGGRSKVAKGCTNSGTPGRNILPRFRRHPPRGHVRHSTRPTTKTGNKMRDYGSSLRQLRRRRRRTFLRISFRYCHIHRNLQVCVILIQLVMR